MTREIVHRWSGCFNACFCVYPLRVSFVCLCVCVHCVCVLCVFFVCVSFVCPLCTLCVSFVCPSCLSPVGGRMAQARARSTVLQMCDLDMICAYEMPMLQRMYAQ